MILLYHSILPDDSPPEHLCDGQALKISEFKRQIKWIAHHFQIIPLEEYSQQNSKPGYYKNDSVAITLDDGYSKTFETIFSFLIALEIPVTIFVANGHVENGPLLWFSYLKGLCFDDYYPKLEIDNEILRLNKIKNKKNAWRKLLHLASISGNPSEYVDQLAQRYPLDSKTRERLSGMSISQIKQAGMSPFIEIGGHTITHPILPNLEISELEQEIRSNKEILEQLSGQEVRFFAYPAGEYNQKTIEIVQKVGYKAAFAIQPNNLGVPDFETRRVGIYSPSLSKLRIKTWREKIFGIRNKAKIQ